MDAIFDPVARSYFRNKYGGSNTSSMDEVCVALATTKPYSLKSDAVIEVVADAFRSSKIREVDFPNVAVIGNTAFNSCKELTKAHFEGAYKVGTYAFYLCTMLSDARFPKMSMIDEFGFANCFSLKQVDMPFVTSLGTAAFQKAGLTNAFFPRVRNIPASAFYDCSALETVDISSAESIGVNSFKECAELKKIDLPSVTSIGSTAFYKCSKLTAVIIRTTETVCVAELDAFDGTPMFTGEGHIYVPSVMFEYYRAGYDPGMTAAGYPGLFDIMFRKIEDYPEICGSTN